MGWTSGARPEAELLLDETRKRRRKAEMEVIYLQRLETLLEKGLLSEKPLTLPS